MTKLTVFVLCNAALLLLFGVMWLRPALISVSRTREMVRLQEGRYAVYAAQRESYADNVSLLEQGFDLPIIAYDAFADVLAEIAFLAESLDVREKSLAASETVVHDADLRGEWVFYEMRIAAEYEGCTDNLLMFLREMEKVHVQGVRMEFGGHEGTVMRVAFSLWGC